MGYSARRDTDELVHGVEGTYREWEHSLMARLIELVVEQVWVLLRPQNQKLPLLPPPAVAQGA